jgi:hypothetical protein
MICIEFLSFVLDVGVYFEAVRATCLVFTGALLPVVILRTIRAFLLSLAKTKGVTKAKALKASSNHYKVFDFAHGPEKFNFPKSY